MITVDQGPELSDIEELIVAKEGKISPKELLDFFYERGCQIGDVQLAIQSGLNNGRLQLDSDMNIVVGNKESEAA